jgi:hypothetical protein
MTMLARFLAAILVVTGLSFSFGQTTAAKAAPQAKGNQAKVTQAKEKSVSALPAGTGGDSAEWRFAHPNAQVLMGFRMGPGTVDSILSAMKKQQDQAGADAPRFTMPPQFQKFLDLAKKIDTVTISAPTVPTPPGAVPVKANNRMLMTVRGRFDIEEIKELIGGPKTTFAPYKGVTLAQNAAQKGNAVALVDSGTIVFGDTLSIRQAIDHLGDDQRVKARYPVFVKAAVFAKSYDFWVVMNGLPPSAAPAGAPKGAQSSMAKKLKGVDLGMMMREGFDLRVNLHTDSPETAEEMRQAFAGTIPMLGEGKKDVPPEAVAMMKRVQVTADGKAVTIRASATAEEIKAMQAKMKLQDLAKGIPGAGAIFGGPDGPKPTAQPVEATPSTEPAKEPEKKVIRIYGLDEGVREIPAPPTKP